MDELIGQVNGDISGLQTRRTNMAAEYANTRAPIEDEARAANAAQVHATTALNDANQRLSNLQGKVAYDQENLDQWSQFVVDEGLRCQTEETSYNARIDERTD